MEYQISDIFLCARVYKEIQSMKYVRNIICHAISNSLDRNSRVWYRQSFVPFCSVTISERHYHSKNCRRVCNFPRWSITMTLLRGSRLFFNRICHGSLLFLHERMSGKSGKGFLLKGGLPIKKGASYPANKVRKKAFAEVLVTDGIDIAVEIM